LILYIKNLNDKLSMNNLKPLIKWVGGKTQILNDILNKFPSTINNYYEPFLGGGSVLLGFLSYVKSEKIKINGSIYAYDVNDMLIYLYKHIQSNHNELYNEINTLKTQYNNCKNETINRNPKNLEEAILNKESFYYWIRKCYNSISGDDKKNVKCSAMLVFLNKTCFRGLYRVGPNGFNVPYGNYKNPEIINKEHLDVMNDLIKNVNFIVSDFKLVFANQHFENDDFIYMDPPYVPVNDKSFVKYNKDGFNEGEHLRLFDICNKMTIKFMMSNADVELVRKNFQPTKYNLTSILCKRTINSKSPDAKTNELIISNYSFIELILTK